MRSPNDELFVLADYIVSAGVWQRAVWLAYIDSSQHDHRVWTDGSDFTVLQSGSAIKDSSKEQTSWF